MFNSLFGAEPLEFRKPELARSIERREHDVEDLLMPAYPIHEDYWMHWPIKRPKKSDKTAYRNVIAWYLKAAGLSGPEVGNFLSLSASRANHLALRSRDQIFRYVSNRDSMQAIADQSPKLYKREPEVPESFVVAHMLRASRNEMIVAEYVLSNLCMSSDSFVVSAALRLGRKTYLASYEALGGLKCPCRWCNQGVGGASLGSYWEESKEGV